MGISTRGWAVGQAGKAWQALRARPLRTLAWGLAGLVLVVAALLAYLAANADRLASEISGQVSVEEENALGEAILAEARLKVTLVDTGPAADALRQIGDRLTSGSRFKYRWYVGERSEVNAFALPGGVVIVFAGLIEAAVSPEELAAVIAHEVAHAELRHGLKASIQKLGLAGLSRMLFFGAGDGFVQAAAAAGERKFSRDAEREADLDGLDRLIAARIDPKAMLNFYETLARHARTGGPALMASHPPTAERLAALREEIARRRGAGISAPVPLGIDWAAVRASIRR